jgi:hypothetical protein
MIDKGDNFGGAVVAPWDWRIILVSAIVSLAVSLATVMGTLWFVSGSPWTATEPGVEKVTLAELPLPPTTEAGPGQMVQRGDVNTPPPSQEGEVYYTVPFASPPNLTVTHVNGPGPKFTEQRKDGFKYKFGPIASNFAWEARGLKADSRGR